MSVFCVGRVVRSWDSNIIIHTPHSLARHELQEEARFARSIRHEDVFPRRRMARRGLDDVAAEHRVEERDELELGEGVPYTDAGPGAERAMRFAHLSMLACVEINQ
jgi:hypothetical protein